MPRKGRIWALEKGGRGLIECQPVEASFSLDAASLKYTSPLLTSPSFPGSSSCPITYVMHALILRMAQVLLIDLWIPGFLKWIYGCLISSVCVYKGCVLHTRRTCVEVTDSSWCMFSNFSLFKACSIDLCHFAPAYLSPKFPRILYICHT